MRGSISEGSVLARDLRTGFTNLHVGSFHDIFVFERDILQQASLALKDNYSFVDQDESEEVGAEWNNN